MRNCRRRYAKVNWRWIIRRRWRKKRRYMRRERLKETGKVDKTQDTVKIVVHQRAENSYPKTGPASSLADSRTHAHAGLPCPSALAGLLTETEPATDSRQQAKAEKT
ncbi:hypothetical protein CBL_09778 [Carabus blaptoides fortunei]